MFKFVELIVLVLCVLRSTFAAPLDAPVPADAAKVGEKSVEEKSSAPPTQLDSFRTVGLHRVLPYPNSGYSYFPPYTQSYYLPSFGVKPAPFPHPLPAAPVAQLFHEPIAPIVHESVAPIVHESVAPTGHGSVSVSHPAPAPIAVTHTVSKPVVSYQPQLVSKPIHAVSKQIIHKPVIIEVVEVVRRPVITEIKELIHRPVITELQQVIEKPLYEEHIEKVPAVQKILEEFHQQPLFLKGDIVHVVSPPRGEIVKLPSLVAQPYATEVVHAPVVSQQLSTHTTLVPSAPVIHSGPAYGIGSSSAYGIGSSSAYGIGSGSSYGIGSGSSYGISSGSAYGIGSSSAYGIGSGSSYGIGSGPVYGIGSGSYGIGSGSYGIGSGSYGIGSGSSYGFGSSYGIPSYSSSYGYGQGYGFPSLLSGQNAYTYLTPSTCKSGDCTPNTAVKPIYEPNTRVQANLVANENFGSAAVIPKSNPNQMQESRSTGRASEELSQPNLSEELNARVMAKFTEHKAELFRKYVEEAKKEMNLSLSAERMNSTSSSPSMSVEGTVTNETMEGFADAKSDTLKDFLLLWRSFISSMADNHLNQKPNALDEKMKPSATVTTQ